jgi:hypothetical protein
MGGVDTLFVKIYNNQPGCRAVNTVSAAETAAATAANTFSLAAKETAAATAANTVSAAETAAAMAANTS